MKKVLATILALVMALGLCSVSWADETNINRVKLSAISASDDGTFDKDDHLIYTYYDDADKKCASSKEGTSGKWQWVKTVTITGVAFGKMEQELDKLQKVILNDRRVDTSKQFKDSIQVDFVNCTFEDAWQMYKIMPCNVAKYTFDQCEFNNSTTGYAITLNVVEPAFDNRAISYTLTGCTINSTNSKGRGINVIPGVPVGSDTATLGNAKPTVVISGSTFNLPTENSDNMALQIAGNWDGANLSDAGQEMITFSDNTVTAYAVVRIHSSMSGNTSDSVKYIAKFSNNNLKDVVKFAVASGETDRVNEIAELYAEKVNSSKVISTGGYYYHPTTDTKADETKGSPKTFDAGVGIYAVTAVLSVTGMAWVGKKRH